MSMSEEPYSLRLRYVGTRFDGAKLPVDVLSDLPAFRDLLVAFAKDEWRARSGKNRVPKGFERSLSFDLVSIEEGSAIPRLAWDRDAAQQRLPGIDGSLEMLVDASYGDVVALIDGADDRADMAGVKSRLSSEHIRALNTLGSGLREGERIEFLGMAGRDGNVCYLDSHRRKKLITRVRETYEARFESTGFLIGSSAKGEGWGSIRVSTSEHGEIEIPLDLDRVASEFDGNMFWDVHLDLLIELDHADRFRSIVEVNEVALVDEKTGSELMRCRERLAELQRLPLSSETDAGVRPSAAAGAAAERFLLVRPSKCTSYKIYPRQDGGILFDLEANGWDLSVAFDGRGVPEIYGIAITGAEELAPRSFDAIDDEFLSLFDTLVDD